MPTNDSLILPHHELNLLFWYRRKLSVIPKFYHIRFVSFLSPLFSSTPFWDILDSSPHFHANPSCPNLINQPLFVYANIKIFKFFNSTVAFYQKLILIFYISLKIGYLNLWDIFRFIFRQLRKNSFHKIMVIEKKFFFFKCIRQFWQGQSNF